MLLKINSSPVVKKVYDDKGMEYQLACGDPQVIVVYEESMTDTGKNFYSMHHENRNKFGMPEFYEDLDVLLKEVYSRILKWKEDGSRLHTLGYINKLLEPLDENHEKLMKDHKDILDLIWKEVEIE